MTNAKLFQLNDDYLLYITSDSWFIYDAEKTLVSQSKFPFHLGSFTALYHHTILYVIGQNAIYRIIDPFVQYIESIIIPPHISMLRSAVLYNDEMLVSDGEYIYKIENGDLITTSITSGAYSMAVTTDGHLLMSQPCDPRGIFGKRFRIVDYHEGKYTELFRTGDPITYLVPTKNNGFILEATLGFIPKYYICKKEPMSIRELGSYGFFDSCIVIGNLCQSANLWFSNKRMKLKSIISDILPETMIIFAHLAPKKIRK